MKKFIAIICLLAPFFIQASEKPLESRAFKSAVIEASSHLKQEFTKELKQSVGLDEFVLKVELKIDEKKLQNSLGENEQDWKKLDELQLPGLFVENKEKFAISPLRPAKKEDILMSLRGIKVDLVYHQANYGREYLITVLKRIALFNVMHLNEGQIEIVPKFENASYREKTTRPEEVISRAFSKPLIVNLTQNDFQNFWNQFHKPIMIGSGLLILSFGIFVAFSLKGGLASLSEVIKKNSLKSQGQGRESLTHNKPEYLPQGNRTDFGMDTFESYMQANEYLIAAVKKEPKVFNEVIILKLLAEDFVSLTILLDVLPSERRENFLANIDYDKKERFKEFIVGQGTSVLKDEVLLKNEAVKMIKLLKVASLSPAELYLIVITDLIGAMSLTELSALLKYSEGREKSFICELLDAQQMSKLIQNESLLPEEIDNEISELTKSEMVDFLIRVSSIRTFKKSKIRKDKLESVYAHVETDKAEVLADAMGLEPHLRFEFLFTTFKEAALNYIESIDFESLSLLFPLMTQMMRDEVLAELPELLAERLKLSKKKINSESLKLKGDFYFYLRSIPDIEKDINSPSIKLAA